MDQAGGDDPALPPSVRELADAVRRSLAGESGLDGHRWTLHLSEVDGIGGGVDLSGLAGEVFSAKSGWASLAAGLLLLAGGGVPDPEILATGCWDEAEGVGPVGGLEAKIRGVGAYGVKRLFVPIQQRHEARSVDDPGLNIDYLPIAFTGNQRPRPREALKPLLAALDVPPVDETFEQRRDYYQRLWTLNPVRAERFYQEHLLTDVSRRCRRRMLESGDEFPPATMLVTAVSFSPELVAIAVATFRPRHCLMLCAGNSAKINGAADRAMQLVKAVDPPGDCKVELLTLPAEQTVLNQRLGSVLGGRLADHPAGEVAWDVTPGQKYLSLEMSRQARPGDTVVYLVHQHDQRDLRIPGEEYYHIWRSTKGNGHV